MGDCAGGPVQKVFMVGKQTDFDTTASTDKDLGIVTDVTDNQSQENIPTRGISDPRVTQNNKGTRIGGNTVSLEIQHGRPFEFIVGPASHVETTGDWVHTFSVNGDVSYFTAESSSDTSSGLGLITDGNTVESAELSWGINQNLVLQMTTQAKVGTTTTSPVTHVVDTQNVFSPLLMSIELNDVAITKVQSASMSISKTLEPVNGSESQDPYCIGVISYDVEVSFQVAINDNTYNEHFKNQDITKIEYIGDNGVTIGSGLQKIYTAFDQVVVTEASTTAGIGGLTLMDVTAQVRLTDLEVTDNISSTEWF